MAIYTLTRGITADVGVTLLDGADDPVNGVLFSAVTVQYRKNGAAGFTTKTLLAGDWSEVGDGLYRLTFTSAELDTSGSFRYLVSGTGFDRFEADAQIVEEYLSLSAQIADIKQQLATKMNIADAEKLFDQLEFRIKVNEKALLDFRRRIKAAEAQLASIRATS